MRTTIILIFLIFIWNLSEQKIQIVAPESSKLTQEIEFSIANFGDVPYGKGIIGSLIIANYSGCDEKFPLFNSVNINKTNVPIILIKRGECSFVKKVRNSAKQGAQLVIIYDDIEKQVSEWNNNYMVIMADDGTGQGIKIPSIYIKANDAQKLIQQANSIQNKAPSSDKQQQNSLTLSIKFPVEQQQTVKLTIIIQKNLEKPQEYTKLYQFLYKFNRIIRNFQNSVELTPIYVLSVCEGCAKSRNQAFPNCIGKKKYKFQQTQQGKYCMVDPDGSEKVGTGKEVLQETLRQLCVLDVGQRLNQTYFWYEYMADFYQKCDLQNSVKYETCSFNILKYMRTFMQYELIIEDCVRDSFSNDYSTNTQFDKQIKLQQNADNLGYNYLFPIQINNFTYFGNLDAEDVAEALCASLLNPNDYCLNLLEPGRVGQKVRKEAIENQELSSFSIIIIVLAITIAIFMIFLFIYRRILKRQIATQMNTQVTETVGNYVKFYKAKEKSKQQELEE